MKTRITSLGLPAALLSVALFAACQNTARGVEQDTERNTAEMREESREAYPEARQEGREAYGEAREAARDATQSVGSALDAAAQTMQIKTALIDAENLDAGSIDVDTNGETKTVTLRGHVSSEAEKAEAERIAKSKAPGYSVVNELTIQ